jgi:hypothetical protein
MCTCTRGARGALHNPLHGPAQRQLCDPHLSAAKLCSYAKYPRHGVCSTFASGRRSMLHDGTSRCPAPHAGAPSHAREWLGPGVCAGRARTYTRQASHCSSAFSSVSASSAHTSQRGTPAAAHGGAPACGRPRPSRAFTAGLSPRPGEPAHALAGGSGRTPAGSCCSAAASASRWRASSALCALGARGRAVEQGAAGGGGLLACWHVHSRAAGPACCKSSRAGAMQAGKQRVCACALEWPG